MRLITSIRQKMMLVVMTTTVVALLLSATALLIYELRSYRASWLEDLKTQADLVAQSSVPALALDDARVASESLALLRLRPQIQSAAIYAADGRLFAAYNAPGEKPPGERLPEKRQAGFLVNDRLELQKEIEQNGERLGTMVLSARYNMLPRLRDYLAILIAIGGVSLALAGLIARRLQRAVTDPIVAVADVARDVVEQRNYFLRAKKTTTDEVGALVDAFNDMLRELGGQAAALQAADRRKDEFLATLAHELRNPMAPLTTALSILARDDVDPATQRRMREIMQRQLRQLVRLIDDLLEVSRISTGRLELRLETLDLVEVVQAAVESVAPEVQERKHALVVAWPAPVWVSGDRTRLGQVFVNLLNNAAKYTDPGGRIELAFDVDAEAEAVEVRVIDNGMGIDPAMQGGVFEMFVQVDRSLERGRAGLGVGLALARQLVELHGGTLDLHSDGLGHGCTFSVRLARIVVAPHPERKRQAAPRRPSARTLEVLLADDNRDFVDTLARLLEAEGHRVTVVYDGQAALAAATRARPDVGLFDVGMPEMNGYDLAEALRRQPGGRALVLVAITGWGQETDQRRAREAGFDHHLVKPVDTTMVLELLDRVAESTRPALRRARSAPKH